MKNIIVYPYNQEFRPTMNYSQFLNTEYNIRALVSPKGWRLDGAKIPYKKHDAQDYHLLVQSNLCDAMQDDINTLLIPNFKSDLSYESKAVCNIIDFIDHFQAIICCKQFTDDNYNLLQKKCKQAKCKLDDCVTPRDLNCFPFGGIDDLHLEKYNEMNSSLEKIDTPIIVVAGMGEDTDKFEVSLALRDMLQNAGYKVSQIGSKNYCELLGFHSFPSFMFHPQIDERLKVICFNKYVKYIEKEEQPDIIIIGIPGAVKAFSASITQGFGLLQYMVFQAVLVDYLVMCSYFATDATDYLSHESDICKHKFGCGIDCYHMSGTRIDYNSILAFVKVITNTVPQENVNQAISENNKDIDSVLINIFEDDGKDRLYQDVMRKLNPNFVLV